MFIILVILMAGRAIMDVPLNDKLHDFLSFIPEEDVIQLAKTSTSGLIQATNREEGIGIITRYSDALTLLNRRRIKTNYLAEYLHAKGVTFKLPGTKTSLSRKLLEFWGLQNTETYSFNEDSEVTSKNPRRVRHDSEVHENPATIVQCNSPNQSADAIQLQYLAEGNFPSSEATGQMLACQFVPWFYNSLNSIVSFKSTHFWPKCNFRLEVHGLTVNPMIHEAHSGEDAFKSLMNLVQVEQIRFNPNTLNGLGTKGRISPHGIAEVIAYGTVHRGDADFGKFEQMFSLLRDPQYANNFKILNTILRLQSNAICQA